MWLLKIFYGSFSMFVDKYFFFLDFLQVLFAWDCGVRTAWLDTIVLWPYGYAQKGSARSTGVYISYTIDTCTQTSMYRMFTVFVSTCYVRLLVYPTQYILIVSCPEITIVFTLALRVWHVFSIYSTSPSYNYNIIRIVRAGHRRTVLSYTYNNNATCCDYSMGFWQGGRRTSMRVALIKISNMPA